MYPELFKLGSFTVYSYGLFVALGFLAASYVAARRAKTAKLDPEKIMNANIYSFFAGILGARVFYVLTELNYYTEFPLSLIHI